MTNEVEAVKAPQEYLPEEQTKEISQALAAAISQSKAIKVTSEDSMEVANGVAGAIRSRQKGIEAFRLAIVKPFKEHIAKIDKFFKDMQRDFDEPLDRIEKKVIAYRETRKTVAKTSYQDGVGRTTFIRTPDFEIKDKAVIPDEFWIVDESRIRARAKEVIKDMKTGEKNETAIPGVVITCTERAAYAGEKSL